MKTATITWSLPTTRQSGLPLSIADIDSVGLSLSADGGLTFSPLGSVLPADVQQFIVADLAIGDWQVQLVVLDTAGRASAPVVTPFNVPDDTPPGGVVGVIVSLV